MAAKAITASMRYYTSKKKYVQSHKKKLYTEGKHLRQLDHKEEDENTIEDRVELNDLNKSRKEMLKALADFTEHSRRLKDLTSTEEQTYYANVRLIKNQVLDLADQFDQMQQL
jgi:hypothetical protein